MTNSERNGVVWSEIDWNVTLLATNRSESRIEFSLNRKRTHLGTCRTQTKKPNQKSEKLQHDSVGEAKNSQGEVSTRDAKAWLNVISPVPSMWGDRKDGIDPPSTANFLVSVDVCARQVLIPA
jgi:hypothetical protein